MTYNIDTTYIVLEIFILLWVFFLLSIILYLLLIRLNKRMNRPKSNKVKKKLPKSKYSISEFVHKELIENYGEDNVIGSPFQSCIQVKTRAKGKYITIYIFESENKVDTY